MRFTESDFLFTKKFCDSTHSQGFLFSLSPHYSSKICHKFYILEEPEVEIAASEVLIVHNRRLQRIAPHHPRLIKNNLESVPDQLIHFSAREPNPQNPLPTKKIYVEQYNNLPINQPEVTDVSMSRQNPYHLQITMNDSSGIKPVPPFDGNYLNEIPYRHLKDDALAIAESLVADPQILIDPRMILFTLWQRPGGYSLVKESWRWICYAIHIGLYTSPAWWAFWPDLSWQDRL